MADTKKPLGKLRTRRVHLMLWAYLHFHAKKHANREKVSWAYLLEWARLGGKPDEVIRG